MSCWEIVAVAEAGGVRGIVLFSAEVEPVDATRRPGVTPDGLSLERIAAMSGITKQGVEYQIRGALRRARGRMKT